MNLRSEIIPSNRWQLFAVALAAFSLGLSLFIARECLPPATTMFAGTANTVAKFTSAGAIADSSVTDNATTFAINTNKFTVTEATGATLAAGNITLGAGAQVLSGGTPTSNRGSVAVGSTNLAGCNTGIGANSDLTVTFSAAFANGAVCLAQSKTSASPQLFTIDASASVLVVTCYNSTTGVVANCNDLCWHCVGR